MKYWMMFAIMAVLSCGIDRQALPDHLTLEYSTYLGGEKQDRAWDIAVDSEGCAYLTGETHSTDFPVTKDVLFPFFEGNWDGFVTKVSSTGSDLIYSTYLGGSHGDVSYGIAVDSLGCMYVGGSTLSTDFPTIGCEAGEYAGGIWDGDVFVTKFTSDGSGLCYSRYLGGTDDDWAIGGVAVDSGCYLYVAGKTSSADFPTLLPYQSSLAAGGDAFVARFASNGCLKYSTYLGGAGGSSQANGIAADTEQCAWITGRTGSSNYPSMNAYQASYSGEGDAFLSRLSYVGSELLYSSYFGGSGNDNSSGIAIDSSKCIYITGNTDSDNFPTMEPYQPSCAGNNDIFLARFDHNSVSLDYSTYLGGTGSDIGEDIGTLDDCAYVLGDTYSRDFPTVNPYQLRDPSATAKDFVICKMTSSGTSLVYSTFLGSPEAGSDAAGAVCVDVEGAAYVTGITTSEAFPTVNPYQPSLNTDSATWLDHLDIVVAKMVFEFSRRDSEPVIFRPETGLWAVKDFTRQYFGKDGDEPVFKDFNGDGTRDIAVFRSSSGLWSIRGITRTYFGSAGDDPVPGDYDGDRTSEIGIFRGGQGVWAIRDCSRFYFGQAGDEPVVADFNGDYAADAGVFRGSSGLWAIRGVSRFYFGTSGDWVVPAHYTGSMTASAAIFRDSSGLWAIKDISRAYFGNSGDWPVPGDYNGDSTEDITIFRDTGSLWAIRDISRVYFGTTGDIPPLR